MADNEEGGAQAGANEYAEKGCQLVAVGDVEGQVLKHYII